MSVMTTAPQSPSSTDAVCPLQDPTRAAPAPKLARSALARWLLRMMAAVCLLLAVVGVVVPGVPVTVFVLMAGWAAARSSARLHVWLWQHRLFGSMLQNWEAGGMVSRRAKYSATLMMAVCALVLWLLPKTTTWAALLASGCMACVLLWLWMRPEPSAQK